jgi:ATP-dependent Clp protease adaptor protein ClpS
MTLDELSRLPLRFERAASPHEAGEESDTDTERDLEFIVAEDTGDMANVIVHNDDVTPFDFVIAVLVGVFHLPGRQAYAVTLRAHVTGIAYVATLPLEEAKYRVSQAHGAARQAGYPLSFTIEIVKDE